MKQLLLFPEEPSTCTVPTATKAEPVTPPVTPPVTRAEILAALGELELGPRIAKLYEERRWAQDRHNFPVLVRTDGKEYMHFHHVYNVHKEPCGAIAVRIPCDTTDKDFRPCPFEDFAE